MVLMDYPVDKELARWSHSKVVINGLMSRWGPVMNDSPGVSIGSGAV